MATNPLGYWVAFSDHERALLRLARERDEAIEVSRRFYSADGSFVVMKRTEDAIELRIEAAKHIAALRADLAEDRKVIEAAENWADAPMGNANLAVARLTDAVDARRAARKRITKQEAAQGSRVVPEGGGA
jgi:hypothetical protein